MYDKIRIETIGEQGIFHKLYINDVEIHGVRSLQLNIDVVSIPTLKLELNALNNNFNDLLASYAPKIIDDGKRNTIDNPVDLDKEKIKENILTKINL